ncbi:MAG: arginine repressor [Lachnospiraceae bacterium]|nr:arginine repressor [Lachnospiraceae bacterium]
MKKKRHKKIVELINQFDIETQEELADKLRAEGFEVTQATVSRDIRELKLSKVSSERGHQKYAVVGTDSALGDKYIRVLSEGMIGMSSAQSILVVKTVSGMAMAVAAALDAMNLQEIVGTIAGDDTIMLAIRTPEDAQIVMDKVNELI